MFSQVPAFQKKVLAFTFTHTWIEVVRLKAAFPTPLILQHNPKHVEHYFLWTKLFWHTGHAGKT